MHKQGWLIFVVAVLFLLPSYAFGEVRVVATLPSLGALVRDIGGSLVSVEVLANASEDPHFVDPRPDYVLKLNRADLLVYNGMELEIGWLPPVQKNARNGKVLTGAEGALDASTAIVPLDVPTGKVDRSQGDIHAQGNPHYLYSIPNAVLVARAIAARLSVIDADNASTYAAQLAAFESKAAEKEAAWKAKFSELSEASRRMMSYHDSMVYMTTWLGLIQAATIEPVPGVAPGPSHVMKLIGQFKKSPVKYIVQENYQPKKTSEKIAKLIGAKLVIIDAGPAPDESFLSYMDRILTQFF